jgi:hypothetical protein
MRIVSAAHAYFAVVICALGVLGVVTGQCGQVWHQGV